MKKIVFGIITLNLFLVKISAQNPYPQIKIDSIQFVNSDQLIYGNNTLPEYISPTFKNPIYRDTVTIEGIVVTNPQIYGLSTLRKAAYIQRIAGGEWSGVQVMCDPTILPVSGRPTLGQLINETGFYNNMIPGKRVRVTGVIRDFQGETQINLIRNTAVNTNSVYPLQLNDTTVTYREIGVNQLMSGNPSGNWTAQKLTGERWEGVPVIIRNVTVTAITPSGSRFFWSVADSAGNQIDIRDIFGYFRRDGFSDSASLNVIDTSRFTPPPIGTKIYFIRGIINEYTVNGQQRYGIAPIYPGDIKIKNIVINSDPCVFRNQPFNININQIGLNADTAYLELANNPNFDTILFTDTINSFNENSITLNTVFNLSQNLYQARLRLKNNNVISNNILLKLNDNFSPNFPDTTIVFKKDSFLLSATSGNYNYLWSSGKTTGSIWVKNTSNHIVSIQNNQGCLLTDSSLVIFIKGIEQRDTAICKGDQLTLSIPSYIPKKNLLGWWPLNGNALDESGNNNHGLITGPLISTQDKNNNLNSAYYFNFNNQIDDRIAIPHQANFNIGNGINKQFTISLWINEVDLLSTSGFQKYGFIINKGPLGGISSARDYSVARLGNELTWGTGVQGNSCSWSFSSAPPKNNWYHMVVTINQNGGINSGVKSIYINGNLTSTCNYYDKNLANTDSIFIGGNGFKGKLDDIGIWNRELSAVEINELYKSEPNKVYWSNNDTNLAIKVKPDNTTNYTCLIKVGSFTLKDSIRVNVNPLPINNVQFNKLGLCKSDTIKLSASKDNSYKWFKNNTVVNSNRILAVTEPGNYVVNLTDSLGCKIASDTIKVFNAPLIRINLSINDTIQCVNQNNFVIEDQSELDSGSYQRVWQFNNIKQSTSNKQIIRNNLGKGVYSTTMIGTTNYGCADSITNTFEVKNNPLIGAMVGDSNGVKTSTPYVYAVAQQTNHTYLWSITNGIILSGQGTNIATLQWLNNGKGKIKVEITDVWGCSDTTTKEVNIGSVGIKLNEEFEKLNIYPNPNNGVFNIVLNSDKKTILEISMINTLGQTLWTKLIEQNEGANKMSISPKLPSGVYKLLLKSNNQETYKTIFIK